MIFGVGNCLLGGLDRVLSSPFKDRDPRLFAYYLQLFDSGRTIDVASDQKRFLALSLCKVSCELAGHSRLACALKSGKEYNGRLSRSEVQLCYRTAHEVG